MRQLHGIAANPSRCAVDEHALALLQLPVIEESLPGAERGQRDRGAIDIAQLARFGRQEKPGHSRVLGRGAVPVEAREGVHRLADAEIVHLGSQPGNDARQFVGWDRRQAVDGPGQLIAGDGGRIDADQRLTCFRPRRPDLLVPDVLGAARCI